MLTSSLGTTLAVRMVILTIQTFYSPAALNRFISNRPHSNRIKSRI